VLGADFLFQAPRPAEMKATVTNTVSIVTRSSSVQTTDLGIQLFHDLHGDGQQQSDEPSITDQLLSIRGITNGYSGTLQAESDGKYWARNVLV